MFSYVTMTTVPSNGNDSANLYHYRPPPAHSNAAGAFHIDAPPHLSPYTHPFGVGHTPSHPHP